MWKLIQFIQTQKLRQRKLPSKCVESYTLLERCLCGEFSVLHSPTSNSFLSKSHVISRNSSSTSIPLYRNFCIDSSSLTENTNHPSFNSSFILEEFPNRTPKRQQSLTKGCITALDQAMMQLCYVCNNAVSPLSSIFQKEKSQATILDNSFLRNNNYSLPLSNGKNSFDLLFQTSSSLFASSSPSLSSSPSPVYAESAEAMENADDSDVVEYSSDLRDKSISTNFRHNEEDPISSELKDLGGHPSPSTPTSLQNLSLNNGEMETQTSQSKDQTSALKLKQVQMEMDAYKKAAEEYRDLELKMHAKGLGANFPLGKSLILHFFTPLAQKITEEQENIKKKLFIDNEHKNYAHRLLELSPDVMAVITIHRTIELLLSEHARFIMADDYQKNLMFLKSEKGYSHFVKFVSIAHQVGQAIETEVKITKAYNKIKKEGNMRDLNYADPSQGKITPRIMYETQRLKKFAKGKREAFRLAAESQHLKSWDSGQVVQVGARLIDLLIQTAVVPSSRKNGTIALGLSNSIKPIKNRPSNDSTAEIEKKAFVHDHVYFHNNRRFGCLCCDAEILEIIQSSIDDVIPTMPYMPMIVQPRPWKSYDHGAYLALPSTIMRTNGSTQQIESLKKTKYKEMKPVYEALDILGQTPWRINKNILNVIEEVWENGGNLAGIVPKFDEKLPEKPINSHAEELSRWRRLKFKARKTNAERVSLRADLELKLNVAKHYKDYDRFYYPHNLDFRGRAYPMHPHLHHLGGDLCRGMLEFGEGRQLGKQGLYWLKIHLANLIGGGVDKLSFIDRVKYVDDHMSEIFESAVSPLDGNQWWLKADDPFQCLATCMEIRNALLSPNHEKFISHLPVHQDGSCNGLQHYAALGRDIPGARQVNMTFMETPADVYSGIAERVKEIVARDCLNQDGENFRFAKYLSGHVDRKLVKQTVMTSVYGVTFVGARDQLSGQINEKGIISDESEIFRTANYAAKMTLEGLDEVFCNARKIMSWLTTCAKIISSEGGAAVEWITPLGLPVVQPYRKAGTKFIKTSLQSISFTESNSTKVAVSRQKSAFPPNFVHSLDSSHMMKTAIECNKRGLCFAGVHDSFWTHAGDVETMNEIIRREFVDLHSQPILENLLKSFKSQFPQAKFPDVPERGAFDLTEVLRAPYFFD